MLVQAQNPEAPIYQAKPATCSGWQAPDQAKAINLMASAGREDFSTENSAYISNVNFIANQNNNDLKVNLTDSQTILSCSGFTLPDNLPKNGRLVSNKLIVSLAANGFTESEDVLVLQYSLDGKTWQKIDSFAITDSISNATHGDFWQVEIPNFSLDQVSKLQFRADFQTLPSDEVSTVLFDGVNLELVVDKPLSGKPADLSKDIIKINKTTFNKFEDPVITLETEKKSRLDFLGFDGTQRKIEEVSMIDPSGQEIIPDFETDKIVQGSSTYDAYKIKTQNYKRPGKYRVEFTVIQDNNQDVITREFYWGVLVVNSDKSVYHPGETASIGMAVLDSFGSTLCDAKVDLSVAAPNGEVKTFSTDDNSVERSAKCGAHTVTNLPDYSAKYDTSDEGEYTLTVTSTTKEGVNTISDKFFVKPIIPFDVIRDTPTRIYPGAEYDTNLIVTPQQDYTGTFEDFVPDNFKILTVSNSGKTEILNNGKIKILWNVDWQAGKQYVLSYHFDPPKINPAIFTVGQFKSGSINQQGEVFEEYRPWQIAFDATCTSKATAAWNVGTTWNTCGANGPVAGDTVILASGFVVSCPATITCSAATITVNQPSTSNGLMLSASTSRVTLTGALTINGSTGSNSKNASIVVGAGTLDAASVSMVTTAGTNRNAILSVSTGTINITGNISFSGVAAFNKLTFSSTGTLNIGGTIGTGGTLTPSTGTVNFNGGAAQTLESTYTYNNVTITNTSGNVATNGTTTINGNLTMTSGSLTGTDNITVIKNVVCGVTCGTISRTGGTFTQQVGAAQNFGTNVAVATDWTFNDLVFDQGAAGSFTITTSATGTGANIVNGNLSTTLTTGTTLTIDNNTNDRIFDVAGNFTVGANTVWSSSSGTALTSFTIGGSFANNGTFTHNSGTVTFDSAGTGNTVNTATFYNIIFYGAGAWSPATGSTVTIDNIMYMSNGTLNNDAGTGNIIVKERVACIISCGTINLTSSSSTFTQSVASSVSFGTNLASAINWTFYNLTFDNSTASSYTITTYPTGTGQIIVGGLLSLTTTGGGALIVDNSTNDRIFDLNGGLTISASTTFQASDLDNFTIAGNLANSGTFTAGSSGTVTIDGTGNTFTGTWTGGSAFYNLKFSNASGAWSPGVALTVGGGLTISSGTLTMAAVAFTITGATSVTGTITISSATGTKTFTGNITINNGGTWNNTSANVALSLAGSLQNDGAFNAGTGVYTFTGAAQTFSGANAITIPSLTVSGTYTNNGTLTVTTALAGAGTLTQGATGWLDVDVANASFTLSNYVFSTTGNTVDYGYADVQTIQVTTYSNLSLSGSGVKTFTNVSVYNGNLTLSGTASATMGGSTAWTIGGNITVNTGAALTQNNAANLTINGGSLTANSTGTFSTNEFCLNCAMIIGATGSITGDGAITLNALATLGTGTTTINATNLTVRGNVTVGTGTTLTIGVSLSLVGNLVNTTTGIINYSGLPTLTMSTGTLGGGAGTITLYNLTKTGAGILNLASAVTCDNDVAVDAGTLSGSVDLTVTGGDLAGDGIVTMTGGTVTIVNDGTIGTNTAVDKDWTFYNLFLDISGTCTLKTTESNAGTGDITVTSALTIDSCSGGEGTNYHRFSPNTRTWIFSGTGTPLPASSISTTGYGTSIVRFTGTSSAVTVGANRFYTLELQPTSSNSYILSNGVNYYIYGNLTISSNASLTAGTSSVNMYGAGTTLDGGGATLSTLNIDPDSPDGTVAIANTDVTVSNTLIVWDAGDTLSIPSGRTVSATGAFAIVGAVSGAGTLRFTNTSAGPGATGTISTIVRYDASAGNIATGTFDARTYGGDVEVYSNVADTTRSIAMASSTQTITGNLKIITGAAQNLVPTLDVTANPTVNITGNVSFTKGGAGTPAITSGTGAWTVTGNVDFTDGTYTATSGNTLTMNGTSNSIKGASQTLYNFTVDPASPGTISLATSDLAVSNTLNIASSDALTLDASRTLAHTGATLTLTGTINGPGRLTYQSASAFPTGGTLASSLILRFNATANDQTMSNRTDYGLIEIDNSGVTDGRTVTMSASTHTLSGGLTVLSSGGGSVALVGATNDPTVNVGGDLTFTAGGGVKTISTGTGNWKVSGSVNLTNGTFTATANNTLEMDGGSKTITSAAQGLQKFKVSGGSVASADAMLVNKTFDVTAGGFTQAAEANLTVYGNFSLTLGTTFTAATGAGKLILDGNPSPNTFTDSTSPQQDMGNVEIGLSPGTTDLASDLTAKSVTVNAGDVLNTNGYDLNIGIGGITIKGTMDVNDDVETDGTVMETDNIFDLQAGATLANPAGTNVGSTLSFTMPVTLVDIANNLITAGTGSLYDLLVNDGGGARTLTVNVQDPLVVLNNVTITGGVLDTVDTENNQINVGGNWTNSDLFTARSGTVVFDDTNVDAQDQTINPGASSFYKVIFDGSGGVWSPLTNTMTVTNDLIMTNGTFNTSNGTANVTVNGTVQCGATCGTITMNTAGTNTFTQSVSADKSFGTNVAVATNWTFYNLTFTGTSGVRTITTNSTGTGQIIVANDLSLTNTGTSLALENNTNDRILDVNGSVSIGAGTTLSASSSASFTVAKSWTNSGALTANGGTVTLDSANAATIIGDTTFNNLLTSGIGAAKTITFTENSTQIISDTWTVTGAGGQKVTLASSNPGTQWIVNPTAAALSYVQVSDAHNDGAEICATYSTATGDNNTNLLVSAGASCVTDPTLTVTLSGNSAALGLLDTEHVNQAGISSEVTTNAVDGYISTVKYDHTLTSGTDTIPDTIGGNIPIGSAEFGASSSQAGNAIAQWSPAACSTTTSTTNATALSTSFQTFASNAGPATSESTTLCFAASISGVTPAGSYSSSMTIITTGRF